MVKCVITLWKDTDGTHMTHSSCFSFLILYDKLHSGIGR